MDQKLIFKLDNPSYERWELYKGLAPTIEKLDSELGLVTISRSFNDLDFSCSVESKAPNHETIFKSTHRVINLLAQHGLSTTCVSAKQYSPPEQINIIMEISLKTKFKSPRYYKKWENLSEIIDQESRKRNIYVKRVKNPEKYSMTLYVSYINHFDWSYIGFFAGYCMGKAGLEFDTREPIMDIKAEDILDEIILATGRHKQMSLFNHNSKKNKKSSFPR